MEQFDKVVLTELWPLHRINDIQFDMLLKNKIKSLLMKEIYYPPIKMVTIALKKSS